MPSQAADNVGMAMVFTLVEAMKEWLVDNKNRFSTDAQAEACANRNIPHPFPFATTVDQTC